tara:strand:- start:2522 stop:3892 length:1371 start_codon:yes stop_codon:yes gene_type:complete
MIDSPEKKLKKIFEKGILYFKNKKFNEANKYFEECYRINNNNENIINYLVLTFINKKQYFKAEKLLLEATKKFNKNFYFLNRLGQIYYEIGQTNKAIEYYNSSLNIETNNLEAYCNIGLSYLRNAEYSLSKNIFEKGFKNIPTRDQAPLLYAYSYLLFSTNELEKGFKAFEERKNNKNYSLLKNLKMNEWRGQDLNNKSILIFSEMGIGDIIQFSRYLFELKKKYSVKIIFKIPKKLHHLFENCNLEIIGPQEIPNTDYYQCLMSLPGIIYLREKKLVKNFNFIKTNKKLINHWAKKLKFLKGKKVGLVWQGSPTYGKDFMRSIPLENFKKLFVNPDINFISLQKGPGEEQIKNFKIKNKLYDFSQELDNGLNSFEDTIAILKNIDLLITVDTSLAHIASTMNIKTWLLLDYSPDWRWHLQTESFNWYDNLEIYKQNKIFSWTEVVDQIADKLTTL